MHDFLDHEGRLFVLVCMRCGLIEHERGWSACFAPFTAHVTRWAHADRIIRNPKTGRVMQVTLAGRP